MSNAPWVNTGYGNQTRTFASRIKALGHEVVITAWYGLEGGVLSWDGIPVYPAGRAPYGNDVGAAHTRWANGRVLLTLGDAWVLEPDMLQLHGVRWIPWFPVDMCPLPPPVARNVRKAYRRIVFSKFAEKMVNEAEMDCYYVPHGIDTAVYTPGDRVDMRERLGLPGDKFIVGTVAANKGAPSRKAFPEMIRGFAEFHKKHRDTVFYIHATRGENGENQGLNLPEICQFYGLEIGKDVLFPDQYQLLIGFNDTYMAALYNAFDVFLLPSMGEGFGIPIIEAQACGCPVIVGDWTAMSELCLSGWKIPQRDAIEYWTPLAAYQYIVDWQAITERLEAAYSQAGRMRELAAQRAKIYDADRVTEKYWKPVLAEIEQAVEAWTE